MGSRVNHYIQVPRIDGPFHQPRKKPPSRRRLGLAGFLKGTPLESGASPAPGPVTSPREPKKEG